MHAVDARGHLISMSGLSRKFLSSSIWMILLVLPSLFLRV